MPDPTKPRRGRSSASKRGKRAWFIRRVKEGRRGGTRYGRRVKR